MADEGGPPLVEMAYRARPYVCGAIGAWDRDLLERLQRGAPAAVREVHRSSSAVILASGELTAWSGGGRRGYLWSPLATGREPSSWRDASEQRLAAGVEVDGGCVTLHSDALGLQEVYTRRIGDATYFSVRIDPLVDLGESLLHVDWAAWASILHARCPIGDQTPFQEIRRLPHASGLRSDGNGVRPVAFEPAWLAAEPHGRATAAEATDLIASLLDGPGAGIALSGGWDSRLIASLLVRRGAPPEAWTTSKKDFPDWDAELATQVAQALGLRHHVLIPRSDTWLAERGVIWRRLDFQTLHHMWLLPLARQLHQQDRAIYDGLAGDILFSHKQRFLEPGERLDRPGRLLRLWQRLAYPPSLELARTHFFAPGVAAALRELSQNAFYPIADRLVDHHEPRTLAALLTRMARAFALSPLWLFGPEVQTRIPFVHPSVLAYFFSVEPDRKLDGAFYREMLTVANPVVAALPSTNDDLPPRKGRGRHHSIDALKAMAADVLACDDVALLLSPEIRFALRDQPGLEMLGRQRHADVTLHWAWMFAQWRATYAHRLADDGGLDKG